MSQIEVEGEQPVIPTAPPAISSLSTPSSFGVTAAASLPPSSFSPAAALPPSSSSPAAALPPSSSSPAVVVESPPSSFSPAAASSLAAAAFSSPSSSIPADGSFVAVDKTAGSSSLSIPSSSAAASPNVHRQQLNRGQESGQQALSTDQQQIGGHAPAANGGLPTSLVADPASLSRVSPSLAVSASGLPTNLVAEIVATTPAFSSETPTSGLASSKATTSGFPPTNTSGSPKLVATTFSDFAAQKPASNPFAIPSTSPPPGKGFVIPPTAPVSRSVGVPISPLLVGIPGRKDAIEKEFYRQILDPSAIAPFPPYVTFQDTSLTPFLKKGLIIQGIGNKTIPEAPPYPMHASDVLVWNCEVTGASDITSAIKSWPRQPPRWTDWVARLRPYFQRDWRRLGLLQLIEISDRHIELNAGMCRSFLRYWSSSANSFIFPFGPMSVTLKDVFMLTGLPVIGFDAPCLFEVETKDLYSYPICPSYPACVSKWSVLTTPPSLEENTEFLWVLICKFIMCPSSGTPTKEYWKLASNLANGTFVALGPVLLGALYYAFEQSVTTHLLAKLDGHVWLLQLWIFTYFPELMGVGVGTLCTPIVDLLAVKCCFEETAVFDFLFERTARETSALSVFDHHSYIPQWMDIFSGKPGTLLLIKRKLFCAFTTSRMLFLGGSQAFSTRASSQHCVSKLYMSSLWGRQFGLNLSQIHPYLEQHDGEWTRSTVEQLVKVYGYYRCPVVENLIPYDFASWWDERFQLILSKNAGKEARLLVQPPQRPTPVSKPKKQAKKKNRNTSSESSFEKTELPKTQTKRKSRDTSSDSSFERTELPKTRQSGRLLKVAKKRHAGPPETVVLEDDSEDDQLPDLLHEAAHTEETTLDVDSEAAMDREDDGVLDTQGMEHSGEQCSKSASESTSKGSKSASEPTSKGSKSESASKGSRSASEPTSKGSKSASESVSKGSKSASEKDSATSTESEEPLSQIKKLSSIIAEDQDLVDLSFLDEMSTPEASVSFVPLPADVERAVSLVKHVLGQHISIVTDSQKEDLISSLHILRLVHDSVVTDEVEKDIMASLNLWRSCVEIESNDLPKLKSSKADNARYLSLGSKRQEVAQKLRDLEASGEAFEKEIEQLETAILALKSKQLDLVVEGKLLAEEYQGINSQLQPLHTTIQEKKNDMVSWVQNCAKARQDKVVCQSKWSKLQGLFSYSSPIPMTLLLTRPFGQYLLGDTYTCTYTLVHALHHRDAIQVLSKLQMSWCEDGSPAICLLVVFHTKIHLQVQPCIAFSLCVYVPGMKMAFAIYLCSDVMSIPGLVSRTNHICHLQPCIALQGRFCLLLNVVEFSFDPFSLVSQSLRSLSRIETL
ncbi:uncharacterized protein LOC126668685 [Mercurialis annua]|uniref:uncharacterized protein LOC126668685 n=1 Tax=Mercurialis annua TaxID=3986 RepID=UPI0024ACEC69|nr:uncharacterized protein LOC126668685 [Mercurialis annua]